MEVEEEMLVLVQDIGNREEEKEAWLGYPEGDEIQPDYDFVTTVNEEIRPNSDTLTDAPEDLIVNLIICRTGP